MKVELANNEFFINTKSGKAYLKFEIKENKIYLIETFVPESERGKGIAKKLTLEALKYADKNNLKVVPICSFARDFIEKNKEWKRLL